MNDGLSLLIAHYQPPKGLPTMTMVIRQGKLVLLDWWDKKTTQYLAQSGHLPNDVSSHQLFAHQLRGDHHNENIAKMTATQLDEYFLGTRQVFDLPLDLSCGTAFEQMVWQALLQIPYGQTISYAMLAKQIHKPTAYRACANANGKNPISLIVPCHRVIASNGSLGGYTGGVDIKKTLLAIENVHLTPKSPSRHRLNLPNP